MAEWSAQRSTAAVSRHVRPVGVLSAAVACSLVLTFAIGGPARADDYPSWDDVQHAQQNEAAAAAEVDKIQGLLVRLESDAAELARAAQLKGEAYNVAAQALDAASSKASKLAAQAKSAQQRADASSRRAGQLVAQFARTGGGSVGLGLLLSPDAGDLLSTLGTMGKLTEQSTLVYRQATLDQNLAQALTDQAQTAQAKRKALAGEAQSALDAANSASDSAQALVAAQQAAADQMYAQLATLKGTTADVERGYIAGLSQPAPGQPGSPPQNPGDPTPPSEPGPGTPPADPPPANPDPPAPTPSAVDAAIAYARAQLGDSYEYGGYGPDSWDCSGLTKASYAAAGVYIGAHGATSQYNYLASQGRLVPFSQIQPGDLIFYSDDGSTMYHTTLYIGNGQMIEAQYEGVPVKISSVRYWDLVSYVARPTG